MDDPRDLISTGQAAEMLGVSEKTIRSWADKGELPCVRTPGGQRRFSPVTVAALLRIPQEATQ
jgi:excisionase family DNA binding protein